jgi:hypothetical protein
MVSYAEPPQSFWRRFARGFFSAPVIIPLVFLLTIVLGVLVYYWTVFSGRIDNLLKGEVFTRSAGSMLLPNNLEPANHLRKKS